MSASGSIAERTASAAAAGALGHAAADQQRLGLAGADRACRPRRSARCAHRRPASSSQRQRHRHAGQGEVAVATGELEPGLASVAAAAAEARSRPGSRRARSDAWSDSRRKKSSAATVRRPRGPTTRQLGVQAHGDGRQLGGRIGVRQAAADRAARRGSPRGRPSRSPRPAAAARWPSARVALDAWPGGSWRRWPGRRRVRRRTPARRRGSGRSSRLGRASRKFSSGIRLWPPARTLASAPPSASASRPRPASAARRSRTARASFSPLTTDRYPLSTRELFHLAQRDAVVGLAGQGALERVARALFVTQLQQRAAEHIRAARPQRLTVAQQVDGGLAIAASRSGPQPAPRLLRRARPRAPARRATTAAPSDARLLAQVHQDALGIGGVGLRQRGDRVGCAARGCRRRAAGLRPAARARARARAGPPPAAASAVSPRRSLRAPRRGRAPWRAPGRRGASRRRAAAQSAGRAEVWAATVARRQGSSISRAVGARSGASRATIRQVHCSMFHAAARVRQYSGHAHAAVAAGSWRLRSRQPRRCRRSRWCRNTRCRVARIRTTSRRPLTAGCGSPRSPPAISAGSIRARRDPPDCARRRARRRTA